MFALIVIEKRDSRG